MAEPESDRQREQKRLFRQMRWVYVYLPPILLPGAAGVGAFLLALATSSTGFAFRQRLGASALVIIAATALFIAFQRRSNR